MACAACSKRLTQDALNTPYVNCYGHRIYGVHQCPHCGAVQGLCCLGDSHTIVLPWMTADDPPMERVRYYDLTVVGSEGVDRRHGWFDTQTRLIVQVG